MAVTAEQLAKYEEQEAARRSLPVYLGAFDTETSAEKIIAKAKAAGDAWVANKNAGHSRYPAICGYLEAEVQRLCEELNKLQQRPAEAKARAARRRAFRATILRVA